MGIVVDSPVRVCNTWLKQPLGPVQKGPISMRRRLDTYGYAPESIKYCDQETALIATQSGNRDLEMPQMSRKAIEWLNPMEATTDGKTKFSITDALSSKKNLVHGIISILEGTKFVDLIKTQGQTTAVETSCSLMHSLNLVDAVGAACVAERIWPKMAGNMSSRGKGGAMLEDAKQGTTADFAHGAVKVSGNHAVRFDNNRLRVLASSMPRMRPPAGASHVVFKSLSDGLACLLLPDDTWTNCDGGGGKFRAEKLYVVAVWNFGSSSPADSDTSNFNRSYRYVAGRLATTPVNKNPKVVCGAGLHFFLSMEEANNYFHRVDATRLRQVRAYFERALAQLPADWNKPDGRLAVAARRAEAAASGTVTTPGAAAASAPSAGVASGEVNSDAFLELSGVRGPTLPSGDEEDTDEKRTYSSVVEPTVYLAERPDREQEVRKAQLRSFRVRLRYSGSMFRAHYNAVRDMLDVDETIAACALLDLIGRIRGDCVEGVEEAVAVFKDADEFRVNTTRRYIDPNAARVPSSLYWCY